MTLTRISSFIYFRCCAALLTLAAFLLIATNAHAIDISAGTEEVQITLNPALDAARPGDTMVLGIRQKIKAGWHTYWRNPGDAGLSTKVIWTLPAGIQAGDLQWPVPAKLKQGPIVNYGYEEDVTLLADLSIAASAKVGSILPVKAKVSWLVCKEVCIPQQAEVGFDLPIANVALDNAANAQLLAQAKTTLPLNKDWAIDVTPDNTAIVLEVSPASSVTNSIKSIYFFSDTAGVVKHDADQNFNIDSGVLTINLTAGDTALKQGAHFGGVLDVTLSNDSHYGVVIETSIGKKTTSPAAAAATVKPTALAMTPSLKEPSVEAPTITATNDIDTPLALLFALLGGLILNLMPCVFPVLSLKALSLVQHAHGSKLVMRLHGLSYALGVLVSFGILGAVLIVLKSAGAQIGWGFQFQSPLFVLLVAYLIFLVGLNLSGVFTLGSALANVGSSLADRRGFVGSFFTGVLATLVATPCTAPLMGGAITYALAQPAFTLMAVLLSMGLGLALPFFLLSMWPVLQRWLPRPGLWMERMKQILAFPMYATTIWLIWVLAQQTNRNTVLIALCGLLALAFAAWLFNSTRTSNHRVQRSSAFISLCIAVMAISIAVERVNIAAARPNNSVNTITAADASNASVSDPLWQPYSAEKLASLRADGKPVFINLTAAWCITCLVNERVVLDTDAMADILKREDITYLKGDWTNQDPQISALLQQFGRSGVPLYVFYPKGRDAKAIVLPQLLTIGTMKKNLTATVH